MLDIKNFWDLEIWHVLKGLSFFIILILILFYLRPEVLKDKFLLIYISVPLVLLIVGSVYLRIVDRYTKVTYSDNFILTDFSFTKFKKNKKISISDVVLVIISKANKFNKYTSGIQIIDPITIIAHYRESEVELKKIVNLGLISKCDLDIFLEERHLKNIKRLDLTQNTIVSE